MANDLKKIYKKDPETITRTIDGELIVMPLGEDVGIGDLGCFHILKNKTAIYIWDLIDGKSSVGEIKQEIITRFDAEPKKAESDIIEFLYNLEKIKAIA